jgi:5-methylcytosine-specific restriction endonuclease McrA
MDHVIPLARGGEHTMDNVKLACLRCNIRKNDNLLPSELDDV